MKAFPVLAVTLIASLTACGTMPGSTAVGGRTPGGSASGVWVEEATGMMGYVERLSVATMDLNPATEVGGTNGIDVTVAGRLAWVTEGVNPGHDYCADPDTGRVLARIRLPDPGQDDILAVADRYVYYGSPAGNGFYLKRLPVPTACGGLPRVVFTSVHCLIISRGARGERCPSG